MYLHSKLSDFDGKINIAFIGLGVMGSSIASHLLNKNVRLTIYNRSKKTL